jgi:opacity protein-like surface antigen
MLMSLTVVLGLCPAVPARAAPSDISEDAWTFEFTPYIWGAGLEGDVKLGRLPSAGVEASFSDILNVLDLGLMGAFEGRKGRWGVLFDGIYVSLSDSVPTPNSLYGNAQINLTEQIYSLAGTYRVSEGQVPVDLVGGLRYVNLDIKGELTSGIATGRIRSGSESWWDVFIGARVLYPFAEHWALVGYADVGGGGSDLSWQALAGVNYQFSKVISGKIGYRYLSLDYENADFLYDMNMAGFYAGVGFRF